MWHVIACMSLHSSLAFVETGVPPTEACRARFDLAPPEPVHGVHTTHALVRRFPVHRDQPDRHRVPRWSSVRPTLHLTFCSTSGIWSLCCNLFAFDPDHVTCCGAAGRSFFVWRQRRNPCETYDADPGVHSTLTYCDFPAFAKLNGCCAVV